MEKKVILGSLLMLLTGCAGQFFTPYDNNGRINLTADEKGMRAFSDMMAGLVNESKTPAGTKGAHYQLREYQEETNQLSWKAKMQQRFSQGGQHE